MESWGENVIAHGPLRLQVVLRVFVVCKVAAWVVRNARPCTKLMTQSMAIRGVSAASSALGGWLQFEEPKRDVSPKANKPQSKRKSAMRSKRTTAYTTKNAGSPNFRPPGRALSVVKKYIVDIKSRAAPHWPFLLSYGVNFVGRKIHRAGARTRSQKMRDRSQRRRYD